MTKLREAVGAHDGLGAWVGQLLTAVVMIACFVWLGLAIVVMQPAGHAGLVELVTANVVRVPATLCILALVWHAWLGAKSVLMDYIPWTGVRIFKYIATICYLFICLVWLLGIFWGVR